MVKIGLKLLFKGSGSLMTGELMNLILSLAYVLPALWYYRRHRTKHGAVVGLALGTVISVVISIFTNASTVVASLYIKLYGMNWDGIIEICAAVNPWIRKISHHGSVLR